MKQSKEGLYEAYLMLSPTLSETARDAAMKRLHSAIEGLGGKIVKLLELGHRKLAYSIKKHWEAYCYLTYFEIAPSALKELDSDYKLNEDLIRFLIVKTDVALDKVEFKTIESISAER